jgi:hypothetical protein
MTKKRLFLAGASALALMAYSGAAAAEGGSSSGYGYGYDATGAEVDGSSVVEHNKVIDWMSRRANDIGGSADGEGAFTGGASGIAHIQQNNGSANGMENGTAIQGGLGAHIGFIKSKATLDLETKDNSIIVKGAPDNPGSEGHGAQEIITKEAVGDDIVTTTEIIPAQAAVPASNKDFDDRLNTIGNGSFEGFSGVASVQQNNGDANQIGIATAILSTTGTQEGGGYHAAEVEGKVKRQTGKGAVAHDEAWQSMGVFADAVLDEDSDVLNSISNAFNNAAGIFQVQQNNGNGNAIGSATSVVSTRDNWGSLYGGMKVKGKVGGTSYSPWEGDGDGEVEYYGNAVVDANVNRENLISDAFNGASGAATVQQNNGHSNFLGSATSIVVGQDGPSMASGLTEAELSNTVSHNAVQVSQGDLYNNGILAAFNGFAGIAQVQQNNGNANSLASGVHVAVSGIDTGAVPSLPFGSGGGVMTP